MPQAAQTANLAAMNDAAHYPGNTTSAPARASWLRPVAVAALLLVMLAGCGGGGGARDAVVRGDRPATADWAVVAPADPVSANAVLMRAISLVGTPYRYGGDSPEGGFDCSGLVNYVYRDMLDVRLPRTSRDLAAYQGPKIAPRQLTAADLVFFGSGGTVSHVGIYLGDGRFVHAPSSGGTVRLDHLDGHYWRDHYSGARRVLGRASAN